MNKYVQVESKFPIVLVHTPFGLRFFDKAAKWPMANAYAKINTYMMPAITALAIFLIVGSLAILFMDKSVAGVVTGAGPTANLLIPGLNPYLPIAVGWIALIVTIIIHEAGHGIIARVYGAKVDSTGVVFLLFLPIGAFVNINKDELGKLTLKQKAAVLTAGPLNNMILAAVSLAALMFIMSTLTPIATDASQTGISVVRTTPGAPAELAGITPGSTIHSINGQNVTSLQQFGELIQQNVGGNLEIAWTDGTGNARTATTPIPADTGRLGVEVTLRIDAQRVLDNYKSSNPLGLLLPPTLQPNAVPYSDLMAPQYESSVFGNMYAPIANMLFWLWFINFNVGIFNALPIGPLDGGQLYGSVVESKARTPRIAKNANMILTLVMVGVVASALGLPYIMSWLTA